MKWNSKFSSHPKLSWCYAVSIILGLSILTMLLAATPLISAYKISPLIIAVVLGMLLANTFGDKILPAATQDGRVFCAKKLLRLGVILYGFRITVDAMMDVGLLGLVSSIIIVSSIMILGIYLGRKLLNIDLQTTLLVSIGSAVCGAAAVLAAEPIVKGRSSQVAIAVATVVLFGTLAMFLDPLIFRLGWLPFDDKAYGIFVGATIHEVAHAVGAGSAGGGAVDSIAEQTAVIVKMTRVVLLVPLLFIMSFFSSRLHAHGNYANDQAKKSTITVPYFALIFLLVILINSWLSIPERYINGIELFDTLLLTMAMMALGLQTQFKQLAAIGVKPFYLAGLLFILLYTIGFSVVYIGTYTL